MKKLLVILASCALAISLIGCGESRQEPSPDAGGEQAGETQNQPTDELAGKFLTEPVGEAGITKYFSDERISDFMPTFTDLGLLLRAVEAKDPEGAATLNTAIAKRCNAVLEMDGVPQECKDFHTTLRNIATAWRDSAEKFNQTLHESDAIAQGKLLTEGVEAMNVGNDLMEQLDENLTKLKAEHGIS